MKNIYYLLLLSIGFAACSAPNESSFEFDLSTVYNQINFNQPTIGQTSTYIRFEGSNFNASNSSINYSGDTLSVTLTSKSGKNYTFQEFITPGSSVYSVGTPYIEGHDLLKSSEWELVGDSLRFLSGSTFLHWNETQSIPLIVGAEIPNVVLRNWGTNATNTEDSYFSADSGRINDFNFDDLSISYLNAALGSTGGNVFEIICNKPFGIIRSSQINSDLLNGSGWDLQLGN